MSANGLGRQITIGIAVAGFAMSAPCAGTAAQRTGDLRGFIIDAKTNAPLAGIEISFVDLDFSARTDRDGRYAITNIPAGRYTLLVRGQGFKPAIAPQYMLMSDTVNVLNFQLNPMTVRAQAAVLPDDEASRRATYASTVLGPRDLPQNVELILALEQRVGGLDIRTRGVSGRGVGLRGLDRQVLWVVDGTVVVPPISFDLNTSDVACVEVRRGAAAAQRFARAIRTTPDAVTYSGVIMVWTHGSRSPMPEECERR